MLVHVARTGEKVGEFTVEELNRVLADGTVSNQTDWAWHEGLAGWKRLSEIEGVSVPDLHIRVARQEEEIGEFTVEELNSALANGTVSNKTDRAWHEGLPRWVRPSEIDGVSVPGLRIRVTRQGEEIGTFTVEELNRALEDGTARSSTDWAARRRRCHPVALSSQRATDRVHQSRSRLHQRRAHPQPSPELLGRRAALVDRPQQPEIETADAGQHFSVHLVGL